MKNKILKSFFGTLYNNVCKKKVQSTKRRHSWLIALLMLLCAGMTQSAFADANVGYKAVLLNVNGGTDTWYNVHSTTWGYTGCYPYQNLNSATPFSGYDFGQVTSLQLRGYAVVGWVSDGNNSNCDFIAGRLEYKIWKQGDTEPVNYSFYNVGNYGDCLPSADIVCSTYGSGDRLVGVNNLTIDLLSGISTPGNYYFKVKGFGQGRYYNYGSDGTLYCNGFNDNDGQEITATFEIPSQCPTTVNAGADLNNVAIGLPTALNAGALNTGQTGEWTIVSGGTGSFSAATSPTSTFTPNAAGTYTLRWTVSVAAESCSEFDEVVVVAVTCPNPTVRTIRIRAENPTVNCGVSGTAYARDNNGTVEVSNSTDDNTVWYEIPAGTVSALGGTANVFYYKNKGTGRYLYRVSTNAPGSCWVGEVTKTDNTNGETDFYKWYPMPSTQWAGRTRFCNVAGANLSTEANVASNCNAYIISTVSCFQDMYGINQQAVFATGTCQNNTHGSLSVTLVQVNASEPNPDCDFLDKPVIDTLSLACDNIVIEWDSIENAENYRIYISTTNDTVYVATVPHNGSSATLNYTFNNNISASTTYYIYVKAISVDGSALSDVFEIKTPASANPAPEIVSVTADYTSIDLEFTLAAGATSHTLYRCTSANGGCTEISEYDGISTTYTDESLTEGVVYYYKFVAAFASGCPSDTTISIKTLSHIAYPEPYDCTASACNKLVGYVNFAHKDGIENGRWSINDIDYYGLATETLTTTGNYQSSGDLITNNNYFIVKNPSSVKGGNGAGNAEFLQDVNNALGGVFLIKGGNDNSLIYTINGLNKGTDANATYCVRIKMRNVGRVSQSDGNDKSNKCADNGNNIRVALLDLANNNKAYRSGQSSYGTYTTENTGNEGCVTSDYNQSWQQNQQQNTMRKYGDMTIFTGSITTGNTDDGFKIQIRGIGDYRNTITGIESIEVYGCIPQVFEILDNENNLLAKNETDYDVCETEQITLKAVSGFVTGDEDVVWTKNGVIVGTGDTLAVTGPAENVSVTYKATGSLGDFSVTLHGKFCCSVIGGETVTVHAESFNGLNYSIQTCSGKSYADLPSVGVDNFISSNYTYSGSNSGCNSSGCGDGTTININDCEYAVVQNAQDGGFWTSFSEHTGVSGSGMLLVNAAVSSGDDYFYSHTLSNVCANTRYEFSVWYANIDIIHQDHSTPNIALQVWAVNEYGNTIGTTPLKEYITGNVVDSKVWHQAVLTFVTGSADRYMFKIKNNVSTSSISGNDIVIDDIIVTKCVPRFGTIDAVTKVDTCDVCVLNPEPVTLEFDAPYSIRERVGNGSDVYVQWAWSDSPNGPWTPIGTPAENDTIHNLMPADYPQNSGDVRYYLAKVSSDYDRAIILNPLLGVCGNDAVSNIFTLKRLIAVESTISAKIDNVNVSVSDTLKVCLGSSFDIIATTTPATEWGWKYGVANGAFITNGGAISSNLAHKTYSATNASVENHEGKYFFYAKNGDCESIDSIYVKVLLTAEEVNRSMCDNEDFRFNEFSGVDTTFLKNSLSAGTYTYTFENGNCGITLNLTVKAHKNTPISYEICSGDSVSVGGKYYKIGGEYNDTLQTSEGCDSIITLNLTVTLPIEGEVIEVTICSGAPYVDEVFDIPEPVAGIIYKDTISNSQGCDSIAKLKFIIAEPVITIYEDHICQGAPYTKNGFNILEPQNGDTYTLPDMLKTTQNCDSISKVKLFVDAPIITTYSAQICKGALYEDDNFIISTNDLNVGENILDTTKYTSQGCDSIVKLILTVNEPIKTNISSTICEGDSIFFGGQYRKSAGIYYDTLQTSEGCDSIVIMNLSDEIPFTADVVINAELCQGQDREFTFTVPFGQTTNNVNCIITFTPDFGFTPTSKVLTPTDNTITVNIPAGAPAGTYQMLITFEEEGKTCHAPAITASFTIDFSLIEQKWDDVIAVLNKTAGGYDFDILSFQWYKNGAPIAGETGSYLYVAPDVLDTTAVYYVELTTTDGTVIQSCMLTPKTYFACADCPQFIEVEMLPNAQIKTNQSGTASIYNVQGILVGSQKFEAGTTKLTIPLIDGIYILQVTLKDGYNKAFKFVKY